MMKTVQFTEWILSLHAKLIYLNYLGKLEEKVMKIINLLYIDFSCKLCNIRLIKTLITNNINYQNVIVCNISNLNIKILNLNGGSQQY